MKVFPLLAGVLATIFTFVMITMSGCINTHEPIGEIKNAVVESKSETTGKWAERIVVLSKDGETIELHVKEENEYRALREGSTVNVSYNDDYYIVDLSFPKIADDKDVAE